MRVSSTAAETAGSNNHKPDSPALAQLKAAIDPEATAGGDGDQLAGDTTATATAVMEAREDDDGDDQADGSEGATEGTKAVVGVVPAVVPVAPTAPQATPAVVATPAAPAPYDPIAECEEEIAEIGERIVKHSCKISELDAALKAEKKSWKTASDELVELHCRKADLLLSKKQREEDEARRKAAPQNTTGPMAQTPIGSPADLPQVAAATVAVDPTVNASAPESTPESTEAFHDRINAAFAPSPEAAASLPPTPEQEQWDREFRSMATADLDGITPKILEILHGNNIYTVGNWQDVPAARGIEYTQLSAGGAKLTEARCEKVMDAMMAYMKDNPRPEGMPVLEIEDI